jgi:hypothetical protein
MAVMTTACRRPYYLERALGSWSEARGTSGLSLFAVKLGQSEREIQQRDLIRRSHLRKARGVEVFPDNTPGRGLHAAIAEGANRVFRTYSVSFLVLTEEDVIVSADVLEYMAWARDRFADDKHVIGVCAHSVGGQGWDKHEPAEDAAAAQDQARLLPYFNAWCWGTWKDRWTNVFQPSWDWDCNSGGPLDSGWDWNIATRLIPAVNGLFVVPDASRSQNIGELEGWASTKESFAFSQAQSFRGYRDPIDYRLVTNGTADPF